MEKTVRAIPATISRYTSSPINSRKKRKVAGYARVSTDHDDQITSYEAQVDYYTNYIKGRDDWEFAGIYTDEGISGTNTRHRDGFKRMVSRFARNTVDSLSTIRKLKEHKIECYFEKENIWTFDSKGELLLTIMSSLAQEESRSISENVTWGHRKRFADGKVSVAYSRFLGYKKGPNGGLVVVPEEATTIKLIYKLFLEGLGTTTIAKQLTKRGLKTPGGKSKWSACTVYSILQNEKAKRLIFLQRKRKSTKGKSPNTM